MFHLDLLKSYFTLSEEYFLTSNMAGSQNNFNHNLVCIFCLIGLQYFISSVVIKGTYPELSHVDLLTTVYLLVLSPQSLHAKYVQFFSVFICQRRSSYRSVNSFTCHIHTVTNSDLKFGVTHQRHVIAAMYQSIFRLRNHKDFLKNRIVQSVYQTIRKNTQLALTYISSWHA